MKYKLCSLNVGRPERYQTDKGELESAYRKRPVSEPTFLSKLNFQGDEQADKKHHGGVDQAVCLYPAQHYRFFEKEYGRSFPFPSFGENITVEGIDERTTNIGDVFAIGEAEVQVTKPRKPCYIIARTHGIDDFPKQVQRTGFTGFYLRVLKEGYVQAGDDVILKSKDPQGVTVADVNDVKYDNPHDQDKIKRILQVDAFPEEDRVSLERRLSE
ncbi:MOSC domain-containing protein [Halobacillus andaensis]|uniref:MOSC domain-containing protein n=1 Tax=Halobacillus andaensis TaxID=1176239 RepID=A0A917B5Z3_HALAA|nr:MOSC domain-containing protein [Halobacillus andaensis]MBP2005941.1 MOSC domain-containing protein YiiM [Halobacillus andaensis]GGF24838.1 MOSC domain-containing protein [Halobacillus andaensis]